MRKLTRLVQFKNVALCLFLILTFSCKSTNSSHVRIDPKLPENAIRVELLQYTPLGSNEGYVLNFARNRLKHGRGQPTYDRSNTLIVLLGSSARLFGSDNTWVQWRFDIEHKLIGIDVIKSHDTL